MKKWLENYFDVLHKIQLNSQVTLSKGHGVSIYDGFNIYIDLIQEMQRNKRKLFFIGNGGSAGICSHLAIDYSKNGNIPALALNDGSALTCLGNDYGYEFVFSKQLEFHAVTNDVIVAISSSGASKNILNAVSFAKEKGCSVVTLSGFKPTNPLRALGDINFYVEASEYGFVEVAHMALGHAMLDYLIEDANANFTLENDESFIKSLHGESI